MSGGISLQPRDFLDGGSSKPASCNKLSSSRRIPKGCWRLTRQVELITVGLICCRSLFRKHMSWQNTDQSSSFNLIPLQRNFVEANHHSALLKLIGIDKLPTRGGNLETLLSRREHFYIHYLNTLAPHGLNVDDHFKYFP